MEFDKHGRIVPAGKVKKAGLRISEKMEMQNKGVAVVKDKGEEVLPVVIEKCPECGNDKAYFWTVQTRASDEAETKFYKCIKCGHTRREYR
ncbi:MAG: zinc ribbon domain-containing protein [Nanoarchaeota archaeon]|nr:zinc ribbon domain-containing protein [Nanoarchaeota archaeon]